MQLASRELEGLYNGNVRSDDCGAVELCIHNRCLGLAVSR